MKSLFSATRTLVLGKALPLVCLAAATLGAEGPQIFAIRDARIVPVSGPTIDSGTVILRNGVIEAVGAGIAVPPEAWVIEGKGLTVYPGMVDSLSTWGIPGANAASLGPAGGGRRAGGVQTTAPNPALATAPAPVINGPEDRPSNSSYLKAADLISAGDRSIETARDGGFTTAITFPTTNIFAGQGVIFNLGGERSGQMVVNPSAGQYIIIRNSGGFGGTYPGSLMGVIAYIRQIYLDADHYKVANDIYAKHPQGLLRPAYDRTLEGVAASPRTLIPAARLVEVDRMIRLAQELKLNAVIYGAEEGWRAADLLAKAKMPVLVSLKWPTRSADANPADEDSLRTLEMRDKAPSTPAALAKAGVKFAFYSDGVSQSRDLMRAVKRAIDAGLSQADAVRALTLTPAEIYGVSDRLGSIEKGKIANIVVTDGDLFQDKTKVKYVFVDGMKYEPAPEAPATRRGMDVSNEK
jgi:imidazolonepropionase-like amidohydrolase